MWRSLTLDQTWQVTRFTFKYCICMNVVLSFILSRPFIAYFLKKNYSLRQNILKNLRVWERSLTSVPIGVYLDLIRVGTWLGTGSAKEFEDSLKKEWPDAASDSDVQRPVSSQEVNLLPKEWPDAEIVFFQHPVRRSFSVRSMMKTSRLGDRTLAASDRCPQDASNRDSRGFGPLWNRLDAGWQRSVAATRASGQ